MTISDLAAISCVKETTVRKNINKIAGVMVDGNGNKIIPSGSRYPYDVHRYKFDTIGKRRVALLQATCRFRYVDHTILKMTVESFEAMLTDLVRAGYLQLNGSDNKYGANRFDTTLEYDKIREISLKSQIKTIADTISSSIGHFVGGIVNELLPL